MSARLVSKLETLAVSRTPSYDYLRRVAPFPRRIIHPPIVTRIWIEADLLFFIRGTVYYRAWSQREYHVAQRVECVFFLTNPFSSLMVV